MSMPPPPCLPLIPAPCPIRILPLDWNFPFVVDLQKKGFYAMHCLSEMEVARSPRSLKICALKRTRGSCFSFLFVLEKDTGKSSSAVYSWRFEEVASYDRRHSKTWHSISETFNFKGIFSSKQWYQSFSPPWLIGFQPLSGSPVPCKDPWYGGKYHRGPLEASWLEAWRRAEIPGTAEEKAQARGEIRFGNCCVVNVDDIMKT